MSATSLTAPPIERMNTVFKFYYQVWTFFALSGALIFAQLVGRVRRACYILSSESPRSAAAEEAAGTRAVGCRCICFALLNLMSAQRMDSAVRRDLAGLVDLSRLRHGRRG